VNYAVAVFQQGKDADAVRYLRRLLFKYPSFSGLDFGAWLYHSLAICLKPSHTLSVSIADARAALAVALWVTGDTSEAESQWFRVDDTRYSDVIWLVEKRRWPPRLVQGMKEFIALSSSLQ